MADAPDTLDLDAYLARIAWPGEREPEPTEAALARLLEHHMVAIPFENLDVLLGRPPRLALGPLQQKLVGARRGGYCYEHATLFAAALERLGFRVHRHSARVTMLTPRTAAPRTHMFLTVDLAAGRTVMVDPGFGGNAARTPIPAGGEAGAYSFTREADHHVLRLRGAELWASSLERDIPIDFEMANHFTATHPSSPFTTRLMMAFHDRDGRTTVSNRDVTRYRGGDEVVDTRQLADRAALRELVARLLHVDLPELEHVRIASVPEWAA